LGAKPAAGSGTEIRLVGRAAQTAAIVATGHREYRGGPQRERPNEAFFFVIVAWDSEREQRRCVRYIAYTEETRWMNTRILLAGLVLVAFAGTAMADEYYVVQNPEHHCTITTTKPADKTVVTQIGPLAFKTREEAQDRIEKTRVCSDSTTGSDTVTKDKD
jgi:hypothetical protein